MGKVFEKCFNVNRRTLAICIITTRNRESSLNSTIDAINYFPKMRGGGVYPDSQTPVPQKRLEITQ